MLNQIMVKHEARKNTAAASAGEDQTMGEAGTANSDDTSLKAEVEALGAELGKRASD